MYCKNYCLWVRLQSSKCIGTVSKRYWSTTDGSRSTTRFRSKIPLKIPRTERYIETTILYFCCSWYRSLPLNYNKTTNFRDRRPPSPVLDSTNSVARSIARKRQNRSSRTKSAWNARGVVPRRSTKLSCSDLFGCDVL